MIPLPWTQPDSWKASGCYAVIMTLVIALNSALSSCPKQPAMSLVWENNLTACPPPSWHAQKSRPHWVQKPSHLPAAVSEQTLHRSEEIPCTSLWSSLWFWVVNNPPVQSFKGTVWRFPAQFLFKVTIVIFQFHQNYVRCLVFPCMTVGSCSCIMLTLCTIQCSPLRSY